MLTPFLFWASLNAISVTFTECLLIFPEGGICPRVLEHFHEYASLGLPEAKFPL